MTIKNTKKNVSAENSDVVQDIDSTTPTSSTKGNFTEDQFITITYFNFFDDEKIANGDTPVTETIKVPISELVRLGYLEENYYDKAYIDAKVKPHFEVLSAKPNKTPKQWAQEVREAGKTNYIFLIPFGSDYENDNSTETVQEGGFKEYFYTVEENQDGTPNLNTEKMEEKGSLQLDLRGYLLKNDFNTTLINDDSFKAHGTSISQNTTDITNLQNNKLEKTSTDYKTNAFVLTNENKTITTDTKVGNISSEGKLLNNNTANTNKILTSNSNGLIVGNEYLNTTKIQNTNALEKKIGSLANASQSNINAAIDDVLNTLYITDLPKYLLLSDIQNEIWGTGGFKTQQASETDNAIKNMKLGDYIYSYLYRHFSENTHVHGNITNDGKVGSASGKPLITSTNGVITTGSFGTTAGTFATGNHVHGNITNDGKVGNVSGKPLITSNNGIVTAGSFGTTQGTFSEGNHTHPEYLVENNIEGFVTEDTFNETQDDYVIFVDEKEVCNHTELANYQENQKTLENIIHVYDGVENALLVYANNMHKDNPCIISFENVGIFCYIPDRESEEEISGTVHIMQIDLTQAIPVTTEDLDNTSGFLTIVDLADYLKDVDVIDNLSSDNPSKPLSARQGKVLLNSIPSKTSDLTNDSGFVTTNELPDISQIVVPTKTSDLENDSEFIDKDVDNLTNYTKTSDLNIPVQTSDLYNDSEYVDSTSLSDAISSHNTFTRAHANILDNKVDKEGEKGLSQHDFNDSYKNAIDNLSSTIQSRISSHNTDSSAHSDLITQLRSDFSTIIAAIQNEINSALDDKVDKIEGMGLSEYDFNESYKTQLDNLSTTIANAIGNLELIEIINQFPTGNNIKNNKLYLKSNNTNGSQNRYDIYVYVNNDWEKVDSIDFSISDYLKKSDASTTYSPLGHTHNYATSNDIDTKISTHNSDSNSSAHLSLFNSKISKVNNNTNILLANGTNVSTIDSSKIDDNTIYDDGIGNEATDQHSINSSIDDTLISLKSQVNNKQTKNLSTSITTDSGSNEKYPSVKAIEDKLENYIDSAGIGLQKENDNTLGVKGYEAVGLPMTFTQSGQDWMTSEVITFCDGINVYLKISFRTGSNNTQKVFNIGYSISHEEYCPKHSMYTPIHGSVGSNIKLETDGTMQINLNVQNPNSLNVVCGMMYPLKSRLPE